MTRVLVFGGSGMLGHKLVQTLSDRMETWATVRGQAPSDAAAAVLDPARIIPDVRVEDPSSVDRALRQSCATAVINAVGIIKQSAEAENAVSIITVNALFPHELASQCLANGVRLIHVSTDCVFSGRRGGYTEEDVPDAADLYARSKLLGELVEPGALTLRTSIVGRELRGGLGLLEWFLSRREQRVRGYSRAVFSGLTTIALATLIGDILERHIDLEGLWHVSSGPINKLTLLDKFRDALDVRIEIEPDETLVIDRSLDSSRLRAQIDWTPPSWDAMLAELAADPTPYGVLQLEHADG